MKVYFGDAHMNLHHRDREQFEDTFRAARSHLDFLPIAYYPFEFYATPKGLQVESWHNRPEYLEEWEMMKALCRKYHEPGRFVTFIGYEWNGNRTRWGDYNVFYFNEDNPLDDSDHIDVLCEHLRFRRGIAVPHHIGYQTGHRAADWSRYDPEVMPFAEIYSAHGCSETAVNRFPQPNASMGPWASGSTLQDALARGLRLGVTCSNDSHQRYPGVFDRGLMAVCAKELTREAIWEAFDARRVYGVTGDRMVIDYRVNDACMGSVIKADSPVRARVRVECPQTLDRIEWIRNNRVLKTHCHQDGLEPDSADPVRCRIRIEPGWGPAERDCGFELRPKQWQGTASLSEGELSILHACWTNFGNSLTRVNDRAVAFQTVTSRTMQDPTQAFLLEARGPRSAKVTLDADPFKVSFTLDEALKRTQLWADLEGCQRMIEQRFGHKPQDLENPDVYYHNAHKLRVVQAVPQSAFLADVELTDPNPPKGRSWYYLRVSETNGQTAWTSPVWVER